MKNVAVIGAGVNGLACALLIQTQIPKAQVTVLSEHFTPDTTGDGSAGFWEPFQTGDTDTETVRRWSDITYKHLLSILKDGHGVEAGVAQLEGCQFFREPMEKSYWWSTPSRYRKMTKEELENIPWAEDGESFSSVSCEPMMYLPWITKKFVHAGGKLLQQKVTDLYKLIGMYDLVINCTGLGSYDLLKDKDMYPVRGQVIKVRAPWIRKFIGGFFDGGVTYILPGQNLITLGGTAEKNNWSTEICPEIRKGIWERCCQLEPSLKHAEILGDWVGLRPCRSSIRLETEVISHMNRTLTVIHNYGHGGGGVTMHWGCAEDVLKLAQEEIISKQSQL